MTKTNKNSLTIKLTKTKKGLEVNIMYKVTNNENSMGKDSSKYKQSVVLKNGHTRKTKYNWELIEKDFIQFSGTFSEYCKLRGYPKRYFEGQFAKKRIAKRKVNIVKSVRDNSNSYLLEELDNNLRAIAKQNASKILALQSQHLGINSDILSHYENTVKEIKKIRRQLRKGEIDQEAFDYALDTAIDRQKILSSTAKNISEITGKKIEIDQRTDQRILKITADARDIAEQVQNEIDAEQESEMEGREG